MEFKKELFYIKGEILDLKIINTFAGNENELPFYWYEIILKSTNTPIGKISIRIGHNYHSYYNGNIGYEIDNDFRGNNYAYVACKMILAVAKEHKMDKLYLACNYDNIASYKTIEKLGARFIEEIIPPKDYIYYRENMKPQKIYELNT